MSSRAQKDHDIYTLVTEKQSSFLYIFSSPVCLQEFQKHDRKKSYLLFTYFIALQFKELKLHRNSVLGRGNHLPHAVFVRRVLLGPAWGGYGAIEFGKKSATSRQRKRKRKGFPFIKPSPSLRLPTITKHLDIKFQPPSRFFKI